MNGESLVVVGAGPKAMALAAKCAVLQELGFTVPRLDIVERSAVGANWTGAYGYTNGRQPLGTPPWKDVGFPYNSTCWEPAVSKELDRRMQRFSWQSYLVWCDSYSDWVDRGQPPPEHHQWASYLRWVGEQAAGSARVHHGEVTSARIDSGRWTIGVKGAEGSFELRATGLVMTGPGRVRVPATVPSDESILTVESFWKVYSRFSSAQDAHVVIVGTGETAAAIAIGLVQLGRPGLKIDIVSPVGMAYSRGESFRENRVYSGANPGAWTMLTPQHRRDFIKRTDRGVFSQTANRLLDQTGSLEVVAGRMLRLELAGPGRPLLELEYGDSRWKLPCDHVVLATGADHLASLGEMIDDRTRQRILETTGASELDQDALAGAIEYDLALRGLTPRLYLPMLAGLSQGPGFPNLSCLGRLSDRILEFLVCRASRSDRRRRETEEQLPQARPDPPGGP